MKKELKIPLTKIKSGKLKLLGENEMNIRKGVQSWAEIIYTFDGQYVRDVFGNVVYTIDGNYIREGSGYYAPIKYTMSNNCIYDGSIIKYSVHGNLIVEGGQSWGRIVYNID